MPGKVFFKWVNKLEAVLWLGAAVSLFCLLFVLATRAVFDLDIWLHLKAGEIILHSRAVPLHDPFSFTFPGKPWIDHEWLFQAVSYLVYSRFGLDGLISLASYVTVLSFLVIYLAGYKIGNSRIVAVALLFVAIFASVTRFNIRPDIFSVGFFALYLLILRAWPEKKAVWFLPLIQVLWVNFHGYFFLGPLLAGIFLAGEFLRRRLPSLPWQWREGGALSDQAYLRLKLVFVLVILAGLANPAGLRGAIYPLGVLQGLFTGENRIFFKYIVELKPTFVPSEYPMKFYYFLAGVCLVSLLAGFRRLKLVDLILAVTFFLFSLTMRNIVFFVFSAYLVVISSLSPFFGRVTSWEEARGNLSRAIYHLAKMGLALAMIIWVVWKVNFVLGDAQYDFRSWRIKSTFTGLNEKHYPKRAVNFLLKNDVKPNVFNDFNAGAYLIGNAYPRIKVFIDGRTEFYGAKFYQQHQRILSGDMEIFKKTAEEYGIKAVILSLTSKVMPKILVPLYRSPDWKLVFVDEDGAVFLKDVPENQELIRRYAIDLKKYRAPAVNLIGLGLFRVFPSPYLERAAFFDLLEEDAAVVQECRQALKIKPDCAEAYRYLGRVYLRERHYKQALGYLRSALVLKPADPESLADLGECLEKLGEPRLALKALDRGIRFDPHCCQVYYQKARVYLSMHEPDQAISALKKALLDCPSEARYHLEMGRLFLLKAADPAFRGFREKAKKEFLKASKLNTSSDPVLGQEIREGLNSAEILPSQ